MSIRGITGAFRRLINRCRPRLHTPTILQMEVAECGVASLAIVLAYHGKWVPLERLRVVCGVTARGTHAHTMIRAARSFGMSCNAFRAEPHQLHRVPMPCIVHWDFWHFVVLEGISKRFAWLNDPAVGRRRVTIEEFDDCFTGVVLAMRPASGFKPGGRRPRYYGYLARQLAHSRRAVAMLIAMSVTLVVPGLVIPAYSRIFVDDILVGSNHGWLRPLLLGLAATALMRALCMALQQSLALRLQRKLSVTMASRTLWHILSLPFEFFGQRMPGDIVNRITATDQVSRLLANGVALNVLNLIETGFFGVLMIIYDASLAALCIGIMLLNVVVTVGFGRRLEDVNRSLAIERGQFFAATSHYIGRIEGVRANGMEGDSFANWAGYQARYLNKQRQAGLYAALQSALPSFTTALSMTAILGFGAWQVMRGGLTIGGLVAFQSLMMSFSRPITNLVLLGADIQAAKGDVARLLDVFDYPIERSEQDRATATGACERLSGHIEIEDLQFGYGSLDPVLLDGLSLHVEPGMRIAFVGASGSGKSTVVRLICGLYKPRSGQIRFDGVPIERISAMAFADSVAFVDQDPALFEGTLRDNLTLWDPSVPDARIRQALKDARIDRVVAARSGGVDCRVEEGGTNFSGGERARIEIARALVGNPSILVLDEATSALDTITEQEIDDNLRRRGCTCIIVAHRLSSIRDCDEIIVLDKGKVIERGDHEVLMARRGAYWQLVARQ
jgi:NHLM bacteriocin system ABC transporter peptidase/ATP-binding protein